jgi:hypothetical protein
VIIARDSLLGNDVNLDRRKFLSAMSMASAVALVPGATKLGEAETSPGDKIGNSRTSRSLGIRNAVASVDRNPDPLQARTGHMTFAQANMLDALLAIAENVRVPFGIACADDSMRQTKVSVEINEGPLGNALSLITAGHPGVQFSVHHGVVVVERLPLPENCEFLDLSIPDFYAERDTVEPLSAKLWMTLEMQLDPGKKGFAGILHPNQADRAIGPADLRGEHVRDILNWMVEHHGASAWVATPNNNPAAAANDELWKIVFYDRNQAGVPGKCGSCRK